MYTLMITAPEGTVKHRTLLFFGEHPREMISVELGAHFLKQLCDKLLMGDAQTISLLRAHEIYLVPIANPSGRSLLEGGDLCVRSNAAGVDINRNWDIEWRQGDEGDKFTQTFPGDAPFSEEETRALRDLMQEVKPQLFISIHSGQAAILTPYAYTAEQPSWMSDKWSEILSKLSQDCPACTIGSAARVLNYRGYGTSLDYAYKRLRIPYTFAFEIYDGFRYYNRLLRHQVSHLTLN
eukprot:TRINITY_DN5055_c0_g1_i10.p1 TRINITY_DN5055_c0_g1~~TRINITY_DN5055_c0_g1_i10.p1  ORF type:complete len:237 (+),score=26.25 TRINITY_DN5055_c0_g1_i10:310-1020(+)